MSIPFHNKDGPAQAFIFPPVTRSSSRFILSSGARCLYSRSGEESTPALSTLFETSVPQPPDRHPAEAEERSEGVREDEDEKTRGTHQES